MINRRTLFGPLGVSIVAIAACIVVVLTQAPPMLASVLRAGPSEQEANSKIEVLLEKHAEESAHYAKRFDGRSPFFLPPRPTVPQLPRPSEEVRVPDPEVRPASPSYAGGLTPIWSLGDQVIFRRTGGDITLRVGEVAYGHRIVELNAPYWVRVAWAAPAEGHISYEEGEYRLRFWKSAEEGPNAPLLLQPPAGTRTIDPGRPVDPAVQQPQRTTGPQPNRAPIRRDSRPVRDDDDDDTDD